MITVAECFISYGTKLFCWHTDIQLFIYFIYLNQQFVKPMFLKFSVMVNIYQMLKKVFVHFCIAVKFNLIFLNVLCVEINSS